MKPDSTLKHGLCKKLLGMSCLPIVLSCLTLSASTTLAQDEPASDGQLDDQFEVNNYYAEQSRQISRNNAGKLTQIDKDYGDAAKALSEENVRRTQALIEKSTAALRSLAEDGAEGSERDAESRRIQTESKETRAELMAWYDSEMRAIRKDHAAKRAAQMAATQALYDQLGERRAATLQRLLNGPVGLATLEPVASTPLTERPDAPGDGDTSATEESRHTQRAKIHQITMRFCQSLDIRAFHNNWAEFITVQAKTGHVSGDSDSIKYLQEMSSSLLGSPSSSGLVGGMGDDTIKELLSLSSTVNSTADAERLIDRAASHLDSIRQPGELRGEADNTEDASRAAAGAVAVAAAVAASTPSADQPIVAATSLHVAFLIQLIEEYIKHALEDGTLPAGEPLC